MTPSRIMEELEEVKRAKRPWAVAAPISVAELPFVEASPVVPAFLGNQPA
jgi:hypothetical protein